MATFDQRPAMRRKSSAQNLLASFKAAVPVPVPVPIPPPPPAPASSQPLTLSSVSSLAFVTATTAMSPPNANHIPPTREWDAQSLHSHSDALSTSTTLVAAPGVTSPQLAQGTSAEYLRDLVQKRIITLTYIRNVHEGRSHWFHTILISRTELDREFNNANPDVRKRSYRFAVLGMSLSSLLDINQPQDLLRGLMNTINEYDAAKDDGDKSKIRASKRLWKPKTARRAGTGSFTEYAASFTDAGSDPSYLMSLQVPFPLDYHQTLISLLDVISEVYNKISKILGPSPLGHGQSTQHMMGPLGLLSPLPGVSYLFADPPPGHPPSDHPSTYTSPDGINSLWSIANPGGTVHHAISASQSNAWSSSLGEMVLKIDAKIKKITSLLLKELDAFARNGIKDELASLDPLLSTAGSGGKSLYEEGT